MRGKLPGALALAVALGAGLLVPAADPAPARADDACGQDAAQPGSGLSTVPWQQNWLDPERVWPFATGAGQTVAVIDTGADGNWPQLQGQVLPGWDLKTNKVDNNVDCEGHGTAIASLIAAKPDDGVGYQGVPFHGVAKNAKILPVRISDVDPGEDTHGAKQPSTAAVTQGIIWATQHGATVIDVSNTADDNPDPALQAAVQKAQAAGIVVVAAVGDEHDPTKVDPITYPADFPNVLGVGAVDSDFQRSEKSNVGPYVGVMAPGDAVPAATRQSGFQSWTDTSIAAGIVAGVAALVREAWPQLSPEQVVQRIEATADPSPKGQYGREYGHGIVNPYRAVTESLGSGSPAKLSGAKKPTPGPAEIASARWWRRTKNLSLVAAGGAGFLLILLVGTAVVLPRGRRRRWIPARAPRPPDRPEEEPEDIESATLFALPQPHASTSSTGSSTGGG